MTRSYGVRDLYKEYDDEVGGNAPSGGTLIRWGCGIFAGLLLLSVVGGVIGFANNWFQAGVTVISPENVKAQFQFAYDDINALQAIAVNVCAAEKQRNLYPLGSEGYNAGESNIVAQQQNYQRIAAAYHARMQDAFRAKYVKPFDVPVEAPTLDQSKAAARASGAGCN